MGHATFRAAARRAPHDMPFDLGYLKKQELEKKNIYPSDRPECSHTGSEVNRSSLGFRIRFHGLCLRLKSYPSLNLNPKPQTCEGKTRKYAHGARTPRHMHARAHIHSCIHEPFPYAYRFTYTLAYMFAYTHTHTHLHTHIHMYIRIHKYTYS